jgi:hypothetical protein
MADTPVLAAGKNDVKKAEGTPKAAVGELLYNGIQLPAEWPPRIQQRGNQMLPVPYLEHPPKVIPIDVGRQLFVDDFLIEKTDLQRQFHCPKRYEGNPILKPETPTELGEFAEKERDGNTKPAAAMISDGFCYDSTEQRFKLWYQAGWRDGTMERWNDDCRKHGRPALVAPRNRHREGKQSRDPQGAEAQPTRHQHIL